MTNSPAFVPGADQPCDQLPPLATAEVDGQRPLALVQAGPEQAVVAVERDRPAGVIEPAADRIEADDVGAHLRQRHAAVGHGDERRALDDAQALKFPLPPSTLPSPPARASHAKQLPACCHAMAMIAALPHALCQFCQTPQGR